MPTKPDEFPRGKKPPTQTPQYWVQQKDRYLRQLLISDIEEETGRDLVVYYGNCSHDSGQINQQDVQHLHDVLQTSKKDFDVLLQTPGGYTDATEQLVNLLRGTRRSYRAVVPLAAKSNGTVLALSATEILMGPASELGPIDPSLGGTPVTFILQIYEDQQKMLAPPGTIHPMLAKQAEYGLRQTRKLAESVLQSGMMAGNIAAIPDTVEKLSTREHFHSHGSVVGADEARSLGLKVLSMDAQSDLYNKFWLLSCLLDSDATNRGLAKIYENSLVSTELFIPSNP